MAKKTPEVLLETLYEIARRGGTTEEPIALLREVLGLIHQFFNSTSASILLVNPDTGQLELVALCGSEWPEEPVILAPGEGVTGWVFLSGEPVLIPDVASDNRYRGFQPGIRSEMAVPLQEHQHTIGVVNLESERVNAFSEQDLEYLVRLTHEASRVITQIWSLNQGQERSTQLEALIGLSQRLGGQHSTGSLVREAARTLCQLFRAPLCLFWEWDPTNGELRLAEQEGDLLQPEHFPHSVSLLPAETILALPALRGKAIELQRLPFCDEEFISFLAAREELSSMLAIPVQRESERLGVIALFTRTTRRFSNDERNLALSVGNLLSVAWQNSQLLTREIRFEEELRKQDKLAALGLLASEVAHEIRNPLTVLQLLFQNLAAQPRSEEESEDYRIILDKIDQLEGIVDRVLELGRAESAPHEPLSLVPVLEDTLSLMRLKLEQAGITVETDWENDLPLLMGHRGELQQVVLNLLINAVDAMPSGGELRITTQREGESILLRVSDTGHGIPKELLAQLGQSFLTSKAHGHGLGLALVKQILLHHHGDLSVESTGPHGTTMLIRFNRPEA